MARYLAITGGVGGAKLALGLTHLLGPDEREQLEELSRRSAGCFLISAQSGEGVDAFIAELGRRVASGSVMRSIRIDGARGDILAWLHAKGAVLSVTEQSGAMAIEAALTPRAWGQYEKLFESGDRLF